MDDPDTALLPTCFMPTFFSLDRFFCRRGQKIYITVSYSDIPVELAMWLQSGDYTVNCVVKGY